MELFDLAVRKLTLGNRIPRLRNGHQLHRTMDLHSRDPHSVMGGAGGVDNRSISMVNQGNNILVFLL